MVDVAGIALPTLRRLFLYLKLFEERKQTDDKWLSSELIAGILGFSSIQIRKDLSSIGAIGSPRRGFPTKETIDLLKKLLKVEEYVEVFLIGAGPLAAAVLADESLANQKLKVKALFHPDENLCSCLFEGRKIFPLSKLPDLARRMNIHIVILAIEEKWTTESVELVSQADVYGVLDLTSSVLPYPSGMVVVKYSLSTGMAALVGEMRRKSLRG